MTGGKNAYDISVTWHSKRGVLSEMDEILPHYCSEAAGKCNQRHWGSVPSGKRGKRFSVGWNGPSQTASPEHHPELNTLPTTRWWQRDLEGCKVTHKRNGDTYPSICLMSPTDGRTGAYCTQKSISTKQICSFDSPRLLHRPRGASVSPRQQLILQR